ncbi:polysaccharide pyruvyl transferase family protein [Microbulbifer agarilyticus]|uniref:polysaccharide pyruvyl transferase family protein n=1 Tax=Microbulbifer agarilyticus TaxID=260552 RepID=UPI001C949C7A|nr:polysaccharide pyruvyl transferase family protein [Microbulbifer agarilyticus]MBY6191801.1 polysaccharide pyruvyl transferase family protein [Microbulbifer agarilyticus]MBY6212895.1 polysaccharide pyruvyl transferase family protein [Microbulbifer agarilyticus]
MTSISLLGAAPDTGNLGVSALSNSVVHAIHERIPSADLCVFDNGKGIRRRNLRIGDSEWSLRGCGLVNSRRIYRRESLAHMRLSQVFPKLMNPGIQTIRQSHVVLDISGGDSFTDLYGSRRFELISRPKEIALAAHKPLILLPQTYGPFRSKKAHARAADIVRHSHATWARDARSFEIMVDLLGSEFDSERHKCGVDVAFLLPTVRPQRLEDSVAQWLDESYGANPDVIGLNISGLIYNGGDSAARQYGISANYALAVQNLVERLLRETDVNVLLVPHVNVPQAEIESDLRACRQLADKLGSLANGRVRVLTGQYSEMEIKWVIARLQWFCGTRMHSTIASLSSGVPSAAIAYSDKTLGVFATCGQQDQVFDPRVTQTQDLVDSVFESFAQREQIAPLLRKKLPRVLSIARSQMDTIAECCENL